MKTELALALLFACAAVPLAAQDAATPGPLRTHATCYSIGIEWNISGDSDHDATCSVDYRQPSAAEWRKALPLLRVDFHGWYNNTKADRAYNMLAGSVLFLEPGTNYEVRLRLADPDGGNEEQTIAIAVRPLPKLPEGGRTLHVASSGSEGDGSIGKPLAGIAAAQVIARPGDIFLMHAGDYGDVRFKAAGESPSAVGNALRGIPRPIVWKAAGDGEAVLRSAVVAASHIWLEGLTFRKGEKLTALKAEGEVIGGVVSRCSFTGYHNSIVLSKLSRDWHIADNTIVGDNAPGQSNLEGEGIDLYQSAGHVVAHNRISQVESGVHYGLRNCDIFGNDIFDTTDDGLEMDYGYANLRMWGNRITNYRNNGISFQPMYCGPWYILRNQVIGPGYIFKFRVQDRFVLAHNTFVTWGLMSDRMHHVLTSLSRNNLYLSAGPREENETRPLWAAVHYRDENPQHVRDVPLSPGWMSDVDYDGFDWDSSRTPFSWGRGYSDVASFAAGVGIERHGVRLRSRDIFENWRLPVQPARIEPITLQLRAGASAIDAGARLPNINDDFRGSAPDLGAAEYDAQRPHFGPRD